MTAPLSPAVVEQEIVRLSSELERTTDDLPRLATAAARAEVAYKVESAKALLSSGLKTVAEREAEAMVLCADLFLARRSSEALYDAGSERCRTLRAQLNALQTISANLRSQVSS